MGKRHLSFWIKRNDKGIKTAGKLARFNNHLGNDKPGLE